MAIEYYILCSIKEKKLESVCFFLDLKHCKILKMLFAIVEMH